MSDYEETKQLQYSPVILAFALTNPFFPHFNQAVRQESMAGINIITYVPICILR